MELAQFKINSHVMSLPMKKRLENNSPGTKSTMLYDYRWEVHQDSSTWVRPWAQHPANTAC